MNEIARDYCIDELAPTCNAYPDAECVFSGCGGCHEYFVDPFQNIITNCDQNICTLPMEIGICKAAIPRYYYVCKLFVQICFIYSYKNSCKQKTEC